MTDLFERKQDILDIISKLDISPTMFQNATDKYKAISNFLINHGIDADMYPQGSFAFGTVIRPYPSNKTSAYDLDFICQVNKTRDEITPSELRNLIEEALKDDERYKRMLKVYHECFTLEYADIDGIGFSIDIVPASNETEERKLELIRKSSRPDLMNTAIAIPRHNGERNYSWMTNNPKGFLSWFEAINQPFISYHRNERRLNIFNSNPNLYRSVAEIPMGLERSALQRVIQILKFHRNVFYNNIHRDELKPISAIINTLAAQIAQNANVQSDVFDLLDYVLSELYIYSNLISMNNADFISSYNKRSVISRDSVNRKWIIQNPADPDDNLANKWNEDSDIPKFFFIWVSACYNDIIRSLSLSNSQFRTAIENAFSPWIVNKNWGDKYKKDNYVIPKPIITTPRPYRK